ncbi:MAG: hypothetical protein KZQ94_10425 [Candidatus Thiodiazotropha sp. (ex Troendleina suluensis)]|nr:hypothetical protein [Candidatus Thiodiazotropha sp. (ex Troendleina suluensis)]
MNWTDIKHRTRQVVNRVLSVPVMISIDGEIIHHKGVFIRPGEKRNLGSGRTDDYDLYGVDARRSFYSIEILNQDMPCGLKPGACVEIENNTYTVSNIETPGLAVTVINLHRTE